jgi:hypothetical protein
MMNIIDDELYFFLCHHFKWWHIDLQMYWISLLNSCWQLHKWRKRVMRHINRENRTNHRRRKNMPSHGWWSNVSVRFVYTLFFFCFSLTLPFSPSWCHCIFLLSSSSTTTGKEKKTRHNVLWRKCTGFTEVTSVA